MPLPNPLHTLRLRKLQQRSRWLYHVQIALSIGIGLGVLGYLGLQAWAGIRELQHSKPTLVMEYLFHAVGFQVVGVGIAAWTWHRILNRAGVNTELSFDFQVFTVSAMARKLPGTIWYAVGRLVLYNKVQAPRRLVVSAMFLEIASLALAGLLSFAIGVLGGGAADIPIFTQIPYLKWFAGFLVCLIVTVVATTSHWQSWLKNRFALRANEKSPAIYTELSWHDTAEWVLAEITVIGLATAVVFSLLRSLEPTTKISVFLPLYSAFGLAVALGPLLVWMPSDLGLKDGVVYIVLSQSISSPIAALLVISWRLVVTGMELLLGVFGGIGLGLIPSPIRFFPTTPQSNSTTDQTFHHD